MKKAPLAPPVGTEVLVYSRSLCGWLPGSIVAIEGVEAKVNYSDGVRAGVKYVYWVRHARGPKVSNQIAAASKNRLRLGAVAPPFAKLHCVRSASFDAVSQRSVPLSHRKLFAVPCRRTLLRCGWRATTHPRQRPYRR